MSLMQFALGIFEFLRFRLFISWCQATINQITQEQKDFRTQFELATEAHEREVKGLNDACKQVHAMRDAALKEVCVVSEPLLTVSS